MISRQILDAWAELTLIHPDFTPMEQKGDQWTTTGPLFIRDKQGLCYGAYDVKISIRSDFPLSLPQIWETGEKIKRSLDWHVYGDGSLCVGTAARQYFLLDGKINLLKWVEKLAIPYLANHSHRILKNEYANGERSHSKGVIEEYEELFSDRGNIQIVDYLNLISGKVTQGRNEKCFCGSGKKYKKCFLICQEEHRKNIPATIILNDIAGNELH